MATGDMLKGYEEMSLLEIRIGGLTQAIQILSAALVVNDAARFKVEHMLESISEEALNSQMSPEQRDAYLGSLAAIGVAINAKR